MDQAIFDANVLQLQTRKGGQEGVGLCVEPGRNDVDDLDTASLAGTGFEQFFLATANGTVTQLPLNNLQTFLNLVFVDRRTVAAQQELADVSGHWVLASKLPYQILADNVTLESLSGISVQLV